MAGKIFSSASSAVCRSHTSAFSASVQPEGSVLAADLITRGRRAGGRPRIRNFLGKASGDCEAVQMRVQAHVISRQLGAKLLFDLLGSANSIHSETGRADGTPARCRGRCGGQPVGILDHSLFFLAESVNFRELFPISASTARAKRDGSWRW